MLYDYNSTTLNFMDVHDETGGRLKELEFKYYDCFCGHADYRILANTTRHHNHFDMVQCTKCGTLRINPYMSDKSIETYYKEIYGPVKRKNMTADALFERQSKTSKKLCDTLQPFLKDDSLLLDFGSGAGGKMNDFLSRRFKGVHVFDYDKKYLDFAVAKGFTPHEEGKLYDMMVLSHVIEHINFPVEFLREAASKYLKDGGMVYMEVPLLENCKRFFYDIHLAHKFYFTRESLSHLAELAGYEVIGNPHNAVVVRKKPALSVNPKLVTEGLQVSNKHIGKLKRHLLKKTAIAKVKKLAKVG